MHRLALDKPGESSRAPARRIASEGSARICPTKGGASSRVEDITCRRSAKDVSLPSAAAAPLEAASWGQTIYNVGIYGSALSAAYRLMRSPLVGTTPEASTSSLSSKQDQLRRRQERRKGVGVQGAPNEDLQAALQEAVSSPIISEDEAEDLDIPDEPLPLVAPIHAQTHSHSHTQSQWPFRPRARRPRNDPSRLSRISYISTLSTQSSSLSSMSVDWYSPTPESPESEYLQTPPPPRLPLQPNDGDGKDKCCQSPSSPIYDRQPSSLVGLGLHLGEDSEEFEDMGGEEDRESLVRLDALLARVQELTDEGMKALDLGSTRIHARLPVNMTAARRKHQPSLD